MPAKLNRSLHLASACLAFFACGSPVVGQSFRFTKILDTATTFRPDGGIFGIAYAPTAPAYDGRYIVFRDPGPNNDPGTHAVIWSYDTQDGQIRKLVDLNMTTPGGATKFLDLEPNDTAPLVRNGIAVFVARDTNTAGSYSQGLYSVPAGSGTIQRIADYRTPNPSGGTFTIFDASAKQMGAFSFDGATVAFNAQGNGSGSYSAKPDGTSIGLLADSIHRYVGQGAVVSGFSNPVVSGANAIMLGLATSDPATGYNGIYLAAVGGDGTVTELVNSTQPLPGNTNTAFHTQFTAPVLAFDGTTVVFRAIDSKSRFFGLYYTDLTSHAINKIADVNTTLPGLGQLLNLATGGVAIDKGAVLFRASDTVGRNALFLWKSGTISRVIGKGDVFDNFTVIDVADPGPGALLGSTMVVNADFGGGAHRLYLATEAFVSVSAASYVNGGSLAPGSIASGFGQAASTTESATTQPLPTTLADTSVSVKDSAGVERPAPLFYVGPTQINYIVPDGSSTGPATLTVTSGGKTAVTGVLNIEAVAPGIFTANADGKGVPAANVTTVAPDLTQTTAGLAACGMTPGSCVSNAIDLGPSGTQVVLILYGTGIRGRSAQSAVTAKIGGADAQVLYAGAQPQFAGLDQVNVLIPPALAGGGNVDVILTVDGKAANTVQINVK